MTIIPMRPPAVGEDIARNIHEASAFSAVWRSGSRLLVKEAAGVDGRRRSIRVPWSPLYHEDGPERLRVRSSARREFRFTEAGEDASRPADEADRIVPSRHRYLCVPAQRRSIDARGSLRCASIRGDRPTANGARVHRRHRFSGDGAHDLARRRTRIRPPEAIRTHGKGLHPACENGNNVLTITTALEGPN